MITIIIHIFPHEVDDYIRVIGKLNESKITTNGIEIKSLLNINKKVLAKIDNVEESLQKYKFASNNSRITTHNHISDKYQGVNDHRRDCISASNKNDTLIFLDVDLYFNTNYLMNLLKYNSQLKVDNDYYVITPQIVRLWDKTWDILVNENFIDEDLGFYNTVDLHKTTSSCYGECELIKINKFKWAGGWFTCMSAKLAKYIGIPNSLGPYGPDDTHMMNCCEYLKNNNINVNQFVLKNLIVCEDRTLCSKNKKYISPNRYRQIASTHMTKEYNNFKKRVNADIYKNNES